MTNIPISNSHSSSENLKNSLRPFQVSNKVDQFGSVDSFAEKSSKTNLQVSNNSNLQKGVYPQLLKGGISSKRKVFSVSQILARVHQKKQRKFDQKKRKKPLKPIIPPKSFLLLFQERPEKYIYNRRIIDYKHCGLLQRYIGLGGKILPRRQTKLTAKQQRYVAKTIKRARIMGL